MSEEGAICEMERVRAFKLAMSTSRDSSLDLSILYFFHAFYS